MEYINDSYYILGFLIAASFFAGFIDSIAGGGGFILIPALLLSGLPAHAVIGTNKLPAVFGAATASYSFIKSKKMVWSIAIMGIISSFIAGIIGSRINISLDPAIVNKMILIMLPIAAISIFIPKKQVKTSVTDFSKKDIYFIVPFICFLLGIYDGLFGPGMGTFLVVLFYTVLGMDMIKATAVSKVINLSSGLGALAIYIKAGSVIYSIGIPLLFANIAGSYIGSKMAVKKGQPFIKLILIIVLLIMFITLINKMMS